MLTQSTRPKCKADTRYIPMSDGVYLRGNDSRLILKGKSLYPLLKHLVPNLNGDVTLEELTGALDADKKRMVMNLIEKLFAHQFLQDTSQEQLHTLHPLELETHAEDIAFIESFQTSAPYRFECFRDKHFLVIGSGPAFTALVQASLQAGVRRTDALATLDEKDASDFCQEMLELIADDTEQRARMLDAPAWDNEAEVRAMLQEYDAILFIAEQPMVARAQLLNRLCIEQHKTCMQAVVIDDRAWLGPLVCPETASCWECAWRRLRANMAASPERFAHYAFRDQPLAVNERGLTSAQATMIANRLIFGLFHYFTQTNTPQAAARLSSLALAGYTSESHAFLPHPACLACQHPVVPDASQFLSQMREFQLQAPGDPEYFLPNIAACVDEQLGLFSTLDTGNFVQAPLAVYRARLSNPLPTTSPSEPCSVIGAGTDPKSALLLTAQKACERYAAAFVDQRRLLSSETAQQSAGPVIESEQWLESKSAPIERQVERQEEMWTWALDLQTQQASLVPASRVFSALHEQGRGVGSGQTWEEALCQALMDWGNELTIQQVRDAQQAYPQVDLASTLLTPSGMHLFQLLKATARPVAVYDVTGKPGVPTFAICLDGKIVAYSTHCDETQALRLGLEQALQAYQSEQFQQEDYALAPVLDLPMHLRGEHISIPRYSLPGAWPARLTWLLQQLRANGLDACVVPLNHEPALTRALPFIVRVLLRKREWKVEE